MSAYRRNVIVGITVLVSLVGLGWMLLRFGAAPAQFVSGRKEIRIQFRTDMADGLSDGSRVTYHGMNVGHVGLPKLAEDRSTVIIDGFIDNSQPLPANLEGQIRVVSAIGSSSDISLEVTGPPQGDLHEGQVIPAIYLGSDLGELRRRIDQQKLVEHLDESVRRFGQVMQSVQVYLDDPTMRKDLQDTLRNARLTTDRAVRIADNFEKVSLDAQKLTTDAGGVLNQAKSTLSSTQGQIDRLSKQASDRMQQIASLLEGFQTITDKINKGEGTAGQLVNDPRLYQNLVESTKQLSATISDLRRLVQQWEQEGVTLKLN